MPTKPAAQTEPIKPEFIPFTSLFDVPESWRDRRGPKWTIGQINAMVKRAYALGFFSSGEGHDPVFVPAYGSAIEEFVEAHTIANGLWVPLAGPKKN